MFDIKIFVIQGFLQDVSDGNLFLKAGFKVEGRYGILNQ